MRATAGGESLDVQAAYLGGADAALPFEPTGDLARDVQHLTQLIMTSLEGLVRRYPDQWYMFRPMWVEPPGESAA